MKYDTASPYIASYLLVRQNNKVAFVLRENTSWMNGFYSLPAGKVEKNESYRQAATREALEEIGITVREENLRYIHTMHRNEGNDWVDVFFEVESWEGEPTNAEPHMHSELAWLDMQDLPDTVIPSLKVALEAIARGDQYSEYGWEK